jgi:ferritin-like protein
VDADTTRIIEALDSFYCDNVVAGLWADAVANRLEGQALILLADELQEVSGQARAAARRLADRIGELGGAITADPAQLLGRRPGEIRFALPDCSDVRSISLGGLERLDITRAYQRFLDEVRGKDDLSFHLVLTLLAAETRRKTDIEAAMSGGGT